MSRWQPGIIVTDQTPSAATAISEAQLGEHAVSNVFDSAADLTARLNNDNPVIHIDLGVAQVFDSVAILGHNLSANAQIAICGYETAARNYVRPLGIEGRQYGGWDAHPGWDASPWDGGADSGELIGATLVPSRHANAAWDSVGWDSAPWDGVRDDEKSTHDRVILCPPTYLRYISIQLLDPNPPASIDVSRIMFGNRIQIGKRTNQGNQNFNFGSTMGRATDGDHNVARWSYSHLDEAEFLLIQRLIRTHGSVNTVRSDGGMLINYQRDCALYMYPERGGQMEDIHVGHYALTGWSQPTENGAKQRTAELNFQAISP